MREHAPVYWDDVERAVGRLPLRRHRRDRTPQGRVHQLRPGQGRLPPEHPRRPGDHRPRRPAPQPAAQPGGAALHAASRWPTRSRWCASDAAALLDAALAKQASGEQIEVIADLASPLPALMIGRLLGFDDEDWPKLRDWSERTIALGGGPRYMDEDGIARRLRVRRRGGRAVRAAHVVPGRRPHDASTPRPRCRGTPSGSTRRSPTASCCSTAAPRRPARRSHKSGIRPILCNVVAGIEGDRRLSRRRLVADRRTSGLARQLDVGVLRRLRLDIWLRQPPCRCCKLCRQSGTVPPQTAIPRIAGHDSTSRGYPGDRMLRSRWQRPRRQRSIHRPRSLALQRVRAAGSLIPACGAIRVPVQW